MPRFKVKHLLTLTAVAAFSLWRFTDRSGLSEILTGLAGLGAWLNRFCEI
jgi:hypothetical protein